MISIHYDNIENTPYRIANDPSVNPFPMDDVQVQLVLGELIIYMRGHIGPNGDYPGALVGFTLPVVNTVNGTQMLYSSLSYEVSLDELSTALLEAFESDLKWCVQAAPNANANIPNIVDGSAQKVYSKGSMWQVDDAKGNWTDTGFAPGRFPPNQWIKVTTRQQYDPVNKAFSFLSITDNDVAGVVPAGMRPLPMLHSNWGATGIQFQLVLFKTGFITLRLRNVSVVFSDTPF